MKTWMNIMVILLLLMANVLDAQAINYPTYNTVHRVNYNPNALAPAYSAGDKVFRTCDLTPMVDNNGVAVEPYSAAPGRARRSGAPAGWVCAVNGHYDEDGDSVCDYCGERCEKGEGTHVGTGGIIDPNKPIGTPLGSPLIPLALFAMGYAVVMYYRSRRKAA